ncbi:MAG: 30S ribosomal protein S21 [Candidatus Harrisonbacteria bacterium]|nr:30S ribosomal protein S21 [Candidatus Harrisonbacteria bacterium]
MIDIKKKDGESPNSMIFRFIKKVQQSGVLKEAKKRKFYSRKNTKNKRRLSALYREEKKQEFIKKKKLGLI